ncbi:MAG: TetR/AcrR family transcriptional regulator [Deltaproteobacteria bacterium]|nr:TetR/AcrR family transcriptional regulator [Deltaproteobacteria bacterium]
MSDVRRKILDASIELVAEQGVRAVSFREVARRAGVSHQTPYHHFGDHHGILREIAREGFTSLTLAMKAASERAGDDATEALRLAGIEYVKFARAHVGHFRVMFQATLLVPEGESSFPEGDATYQVLVDIVTRAHEQGLGRGLSVETISRLSWSTVHGLSVLMIEGAMLAKGSKGDETAITRQVVSALSKVLAPD